MKHKLNTLSTMSQHKSKIVLNSKYKKSKADNNTSRSVQAVPNSSDRPPYNTDTPTCSNPAESGRTKPKTLFKTPSSTEINSRSTHDASTSLINTSSDTPSPIANHTRLGNAAKNLLEQIGTYDPRKEALPPALAKAGIYKKAENMINAKYPKQTKRVQFAEANEKIKNLTKKHDMPSTSSDGASNTFTPNYDNFFDPHFYRRLDSRRTGPPKCPKQFGRKDNSLTSWPPE